MVPQPPCHPGHQATPGLLEGLGAKAATCQGGIRCKGKVVAKCYGYNREFLYRAHKDGLCVPCQEGEEVGGRGGGGAMGSGIEHCAQCSLPMGTTTGHGGVGGGREVVAPVSTEEEGGGVAGHPDQCPLGMGHTSG